MNKEVMIFYIRNGQSTDYTQINYSLVTTISYANLYLNADGSLNIPTNFYPVPIISTAHSQGVKVVLVVGNTNASSIDQILANNNGETNKAINNLLNQVEKYGFDGLDCDLEGINVTNTINGQPNKGLMTTFITNVSSTFKTANSNYRLSIDVAGYYPAVDKVFDLPTLQYKLDFVMIMGYDWFGDWTTTTGPNSPMNLDGLDTGTGNVPSIRHYESEMSKNKLLFGVPYYGYEYQTVSGIRLANRKPNGTVTTLLYNQFIDSVLNYTNYFDNTWQTPWYVRLDKTGQYYQGQYDNVKSLGIKYDFVNSEGLGGIGIWAVNYGLGRNELWNLIASKFTTALGLIQISPACSCVQLGTTLQLTAICKDQSSNTIICPPLSWKSNNTSVATISSTGLLKGVAKGTVNITAYASGISSNISKITIY